MFSRHSKCLNSGYWGQSGVTLIELMVVVIIVGIMASLAYPSYMEYVRRGNRADAKSILLENAQFLERNYTEANRYDQNSAGVAIALPVTQSPASGSAKFTITIVAGQNTYTLSATPSGSYADPECGAITLDDAGVKTESGSRDVAYCWGK